MADGEIEVEAMNGDPPIPPTSNLGSVANGDQLQYEIDNANVPPEQRSDWPLPSFDARDWAKAFCKGAKEKGLEIDEEWMLTWFACALMRGFDERAARSVHETEARYNARLDELSTLPHDWDSYGAVPPRGDCLAKARQIAPLLPGEWSVVPMSNGGIQLEQHCGGLDIELMIEGTSPLKAGGDGS